jgi:uncharacterized membrane protein
MSHRHGGSAHSPRRRLVTTVAVALGVLTFVAMIVLWPRGPEAPARIQGLGFVSEVVGARVVAAQPGPCPGTTPEEGVTCTRITYELVEGPEAGQMVQELVGVRTERLQAGEDVLLAHYPSAQEPFRYRFFDRERRGTLLWLALLFAAAVILLGGLRGVAALAGLGASLLVLILFVIPAVLEGQSPFPVAVVGASAIAFLALYLAHGFTTMTTVALLGTLASLGLTAALSQAFVGLADLTGLASEEASVVQFGAAQVNLAGLVLGGVVIGALGAIDDMTVTQASAVWELRSVNPGMKRSGLLRSGLRIGRDHVASTVNTLALAYAGASMPLLILFALSRQPLSIVATTEVVATEIVRTLVGSIGLVAAVPITTWLATSLVAEPDARAQVLPRPAGRPHHARAKRRRADQA